MKKKHSKSLKKWVRISLLVMIIFGFFLATSLIVTCVSWVKPSDNSVISSYQVNQNLDYKVYLYKNSYIEKEYLPKNESYISDLIKNIEATFTYRFSNSKKLDFDYEYSIDAIIQGEYKLNDEASSSKLWTKNYTLMEPKKGSVTDQSVFTVNETVSIDYHFYDNIVSEFRKELKLPITAQLFIVFHIDIDGDVDNQKIIESKDMKMIIPLNLQAFKITEDLVPEESKNIIEEKNVTEKIDQNKLIGGIVLEIVTFLLFIFSFRQIFNIAKKSKYEIEKNRYLKEYGDIIVEVVTPVDSSNLKVIQVKNFSELVDLEEELRVPIVFYDDPDMEEGEFSIVHNDIFYIYILNNDSNE